MPRPVLSICIPTYNRALFLHECLESIVSQLTTPEMQGSVEIVLTDNASTDNTESVVKEFQKKYPNIAYYKNEKNLGFDRSFSRLIDKSTGEYCLTLGDDDALFEGSIEYILKKLKKSDTPFYMLNNWGYDHELKRPVLPYPSVRINEDKHYQKLSDYVHSIHEYTNLVGAFVGLSLQLFKRDPWVAYQGREAFFDTLAIHMFVLLSVYKDSPYTLIAKPIVKTRSSNIRWDVFKGLETIQGRIKATIKTVSWINNHFELGIPPYKMYPYFYIREYWFTGKEIAKIFLQKIGLKKTIDWYRKLRELRTKYEK